MDTDFITSLITSSLDNLQFVIAILLFVMISACFLGRYVVLTKKLIFSSFGVVSLTIIGTVITNLVCGDEIGSDLYVICNLILTIAMFIYAFVFYLFAYKEKRILRAIEATVCLYLFNMYINTVTEISIVYFIGGTDKEFSEIFYDNLGKGKLWILMSAVTFLITVALFVIVYFGFYKKKRYHVLGIPYRILFVVWTILFTTFPMIPASMSDGDFSADQRYYVISIMFGVGIIILGVAAPVIMIVSAAERALREKNRSQEAYLAAELEYIGQYKRKQTETNRFRHDIKNNLALTQMMLEEGHTEEAKAHVADMLGNVSALSPQYVTGDEMLDLIVSMKADRMNELNIRFTLDGVADGGLNIKPMDMCSIFANALDNAIEAASKCETPSIDLSIKRTDKFFVIRITNTTIKKIDIGRLLSSSGYTSKSDKDHHGFGLMNVRTAIENYNGILKAESDNNKFTLSIMLPRVK